MAQIGDDDGKLKQVYNFKVFRIYSRFSGDRFQKYSADLAEALLNESKRVGTILTGGRWYRQKIIDRRTWHG